MRRKSCVADHDTRKPVDRMFEDGGSRMVDGSRKKRSSPQKNSFVLLKDVHDQTSSKMEAWENSGCYSWKEGVTRGDKIKT